MAQKDRNNMNKLKKSVFKIIFSYDKMESIDDFCRELGKLNEITKL